MSGPWKYLELDVFRLRQVIAAEFLRHMETVIEIGGYITPCAEHCAYDQRVITIDERAQGVENAKHEYIKKYYPVPLNIEGPYGVVILGMELHMEHEGWLELYKLIDGASMVVIEIPWRHAPSYEQLTKITYNTKKKIVRRINLDLWSEEFETLQGSSPIFHERNIYVLR